MSDPRQTCTDRPTTVPHSPETQARLDALYAEPFAPPKGVRIKEPKCGVVMDDGATASPPPTLADCRPSESDMIHKVPVMDCGGNRRGDTIIMDEGGSACACAATVADYSRVLDSGARQDFDTGSRRDTRDGKGRYDLLPPYALARLARHFENGAVKYGDRNWEKGQPLSRYLDSAIRHAFKFLGGSRDEDHAIAAAWNLLCMIETEQRIREGRLPATINDLPEAR